jgi:peptide/nickel transport system permease protein
MSVTTSQPISRSRSQLRYLVGFFLVRPLSLFGLGIVVFYMLLMLFGESLAPYDPITPTTEHLTPPSAQHWLGTDRAGLDVFSRLISAPRIDLTIGLSASILGALIGTPLGVVSGYVRGGMGALVARVFDVIQCLPPFIVAMSLVSFSGQSVQNVIVVLALLTSPIYVRLVRSKVNAIKQRKFVEAATCLGNSRWRIIFHHLLPNSLEPVLIMMPVNVGWAVLMAAGLSFVGAGIRPPAPEWGSMISLGAPLIMTGQWWIALFPGLAIGICVLGLALLANALEILLDPARA